ncbi:MAG: hypothetical protein JWP00_3655 [Chloroflexi bacterium]|jgi:hypothetical protein|nr:hypothetical protein [Chloroflexota bacterium]
MTNLPQEGHFDQTLDAATELTELEYAASQRQLSGQEQQRLEQLRQGKDQIIDARRERAREGQLTDSTVVNGDDSA